MFKRFLNSRITRRSILLFGSLGLLFGVIYGIGGLIIDTLVSLGYVSNADTPGLSIGTLLALLALVVMPIMGVIAGLIVGSIITLMSNHRF